MRPADLSPSGKSRQHDRGAHPPDYMLFMRMQIMSLKTTVQFILPRCPSLERIFCRYAAKDCEIFYLDLIIILTSVYLSLQRFQRQLLTLLGVRALSLTLMMLHFLKRVLCGGKFCFLKLLKNLLNPLKLLSSSTH